MLLTLKSDSTDALELRDLLGKTLSSQDRETALALVRANTGIAHAIETANEYVAIAENECAKMPASMATNALRDAPRALLNSVIR